MPGETGDKPAGETEVAQPAAAAAPPAADLQK